MRFQAFAEKLRVSVWPAAAHVEYPFSRLARFIWDRGAAAL